MDANRCVNAQNDKIPMLTHEVPLREVMFGVWCAISATKTTGRSRFTRFCLKRPENVDRFPNLHDTFQLNAISHRRSLAALVLFSRFAESDTTVTPSVTCLA